MTEETAKRAKELYEQKSKLSDSLGKLLNSNVIEIGYINNGSSGFGCYYSGYPTIDMKFCRLQLTDFVVTKLKSELQRVELELEKLNCY